jgi:hypothetical protein
MTGGLGLLSVRGLNDVQLWWTEHRAGAWRRERASRVDRMNMINKAAGAETATATVSGIKKLMRCDPNPPVLEHTIPAKILAGEPVKKWHDIHVDPTNQFCVGIWESGTGKWEIDFKEDEFIAIISGKITLTDEAGHAETFGPGDAVVVPRGFKGTWETVEPVKKWYAAFENLRD